MALGETKPKIYRLAVISQSSCEILMKSVELVVDIQFAAIVKNWAVGIDHTVYLRQVIQRAKMSSFLEIRVLQNLDSR